MSDTSQNNKRIAKNTLLLYFRMLLLMVVSLYTSRVTLEALGVEDYGIYNVVGGVVAMFSILSGSLTAAIQRFLTFELGKGDKERLKVTFSTSVNIQIGMALAIVLLAEIAGVWFLNNKMNISPDRLYAANWVLQCSILTFAINLISVPYNAAIIAHEKMSAFAYISILEAMLKLVVVYILYISLFDRLVIYAMLLMAVSLLLRVIYGVYCKKMFEECTYHFIYDRSLLKEMSGFAGWNFIGSTAGILRSQGVNIVINLFCGAAINAARAISSQIGSVVTSFSMNFLTAINPQITKAYAADEREYLMQLINRGARLSYYLILLFALPIIIEADTILSIWLVEVPERTVSFVRLMLVFSLSEALSYPLITAMLATGRIKNFQIVVGGLQLLNLPVSYIFLKFGMVPEVTIIVAILLSQVSLIARLIMLRPMIGIRLRDYMANVYYRVFVVSIFASVLPLLISRSLENNLLNAILIVLLSFVSSLVTVYLLGLDSIEKEFVIRKVSLLKLAIRDVYKK